MPFQDSCCSTARTFDCPPVFGEQIDQHITVVSLYFDYSAFDGATRAALLLEAGSEFLELLAPEWDPGYDGYALAFTTLRLLCDSDDTVSLRGAAAPAAGALWGRFPAFRAHATAVGGVHQTAVSTPSCCHVRNPVSCRVYTRRRVRPPFRSRTQHITNRGTLADPGRCRRLPPGGGPSAFARDTQAFADELNRFLHPMSAGTAGECQDTSSGMINPSGFRTP